MNNSHELNQFKTNINLVDYAATFGYSIDNRESSRSNIVMRDDQNDKIIITQQSHNQHWIYWSDRDQNDQGTIIDFIQRRRRQLSLGQVRQELRSWNGNSSDSYIVIPSSQDSSSELDLMLTEYRKTKPISNHPYLINERKIPSSTLHHKKFAGRIRIDSHNNAIFPHFDSGQVCCYELKNSNFTGFAPHGKRGLWCSVYHHTNNRIIITESAIDALSFHALHGHQNDFYLSLGGQLGKKQIPLIQRVADQLTSDGLVAVAVDRDSQGDSYWQNLSEALQSVSVTRLLPHSKDWNEDLIGQLGKENLSP